MLLAIAAGGAVGSVLRYLLGIWMIPVSGTFPWGTFAVNVLGSFALGALTSGLGGSGVSPEVRAALTVGLCGGFTTFSTYALDVNRLLQMGQFTRATLYASASVLLSVTALMWGISVGRAIARAVR